ncbi:hypothetical protein FACS1894188_11440 [Clostridia bacterium]|nr:hypothetical protein FACS1894188_11440 [Clostridia bacterium]
MREVWLSVKEYAELKGCSEQNVRKSIHAGKLKYVEVRDTVGGASGKAYRIPLSGISRKLQIAYKKQGIEQIELDFTPLSEDKPVSPNLSDREREEAAAWKGILKEWNLYRETSEAPNKETADADFIKIYNETHTDEEPMNA